MVCYLDAWPLENFSFISHGWFPFFPRKGKKTRSCYNISSIMGHEIYKLLRPCCLLICHKKKKPANSNTKQVMNHLTLLIDGHQWFSCETSKSTIFASLDHETMVKTTLNSLIYILWKNLSEKTPPRAPFSTKQTTSQEFSQVYVTTGFPLESIRTYIAITSLEKLILGCSLHMPGWIAESTFFRAEWIILNLDIFTTHFLTLIILDQTSIRVLWISD